MHKVIWKYRLELQDQQFVEMPPNARILCVQIQQSIPTIWAMVDSDSREREKRSILIVPTGYEQPGLGASSTTSARSRPREAVLSSMSSRT